MTLSLSETGMVQAATLKHQDSVTVNGSTLRKPRRDEASGTTFVPMIPKGPWTVLHEISTISDFSLVLPTTELVSAQNSLDYQPGEGGLP